MIATAIASPTSFVATDLYDSTPRVIDLQRTFDVGTVVNFIVVNFIVVNVVKVDRRDRVEDSKKAQCGDLLLWIGFYLTHNLGALQNQFTNRRWCVIAVVMDSVDDGLKAFHAVAM